MTGSGKDTVADLVAAKLGVARVKLTPKDIAKEMGISILEWQARADEDPAIDREFDNRVSTEAHKGDCVVSTWLGAWTIRDADMRVWLAATEEVRAHRISGRDKMTFMEAITHIKARDGDNKKRYKNIYGISLDDHSAFDLVINTEFYVPEQCANIIVCAMNEKRKTNR